MNQPLLTTASGRQELIKIYRDGLFQDVLPFWLPRCVDQEHGGFLTSFDHDGSLVDTDKGVWQQGRFTWLLGELFNNVERRDSWLDCMQHGIDFLERYCFDPSDGRMWFHLNRQGQPIRKRRYAFSESFAAIAFGEMAQATGSEQYRDRAERLFLQFANHQAPPKHTAVRPTRGLALPMITLVTAQQLRDSIDLPNAQWWVDQSIETIASCHCHPEIECVMETVGPKGQLIDSFDGRLLNPGHAIEGAWFIMHEGDRQNDAWLIDLGCQMLDWMWQRGWDEEHGGLLYFCDVEQRPVQEYWHDMKFWWPHNETILATLLAWCLTGNEKYARWHQQIHDWSYQHFADPEHGEWWGYLHRDGSRSSSLKGNLWKGPFHLPRMQLECWQRLNRLSATID